MRIDLNGLPTDSQRDHITGTEGHYAKACAERLDAPDDPEDK